MIRIKTLLLTFLLGLICALQSSFATEIKGNCSRSCSFTVQIHHARQYVISITWSGAGGASGTPVVSGVDKDQSFYMAPGQYTIHANYFDGSGTAKDPAFLNCGGSQFKFAFTSHGQNCAAYDEASVLVTAGK